MVYHILHLKFSIWIFIRYLLFSDIKIVPECIDIRHRPVCRIASLHVFVANRTWKLIANIELDALNEFNTVMCSVCTV